MHRTFIVELEQLADACDAAVDRDASGADLAARYARLRERAAKLNDHHAWASPAEFASQHPTRESLALIGSLERAFGAHSAPNLEITHGADARVVAAISALSSWARGVRTAYVVLDTVDGRPP